jgi:thiol-disulfide isomerase/thioredoxin
MRKIAWIMLLATGLTWNLESNAQQVVKVIKLPELQSYLAQQDDTIRVVNFWATWCKPCVMELPHFLETYQEMKSQKVQFLFVSLDFVQDYEKRLAPFVKNRKMTAPVVLLDEPDYNSWIDKIDPRWEGAIPATLIVNNKTKLREFVNGELSKENLISKITKNL